jgi:hypothetical protein
MRLTVIEEFFYHANRVEFPASCFLNLHCIGTLDRETLTAAWRETLAANPLTNSQVVRAGRLHWEGAGQSLPIAWVAPGDSAPAGTFQDLSADPGLQLLVLPTPLSDGGTHGFMLRLQFHHACCDGLGIFQFASELLLSYAKKLQQDPAETEPDATPGRADPGRADLALRGKSGLGFWKMLRMLPRQLVGLRGIVGFLRRQPVPVISHEFPNLPAEMPPGFPAMRSLMLTVDQSDRLAKVASRLGVSMNTLLARDLFVAIDSFRRELGDDYSEHQWLRMMIPMNMRTRYHRRLSVANIVSSVFLDRRGIDCDNQPSLLQSLHDEMRLIHNNHLSVIFLWSLAACRLLPGGIRKSAQQEKGDITCVFTNLGRVFNKTRLPTDDGKLVVGDFLLDHIDVLAPIQPGCCAVFAANRYARRFGFTLHYDPRPMSDDQAQTLMDAFANQVARTIEESENQVDGG